MRMANPVLLTGVLLVAGWFWGTWSLERSNRALSLAFFCPVGRWQRDAPNILGVIECDADLQSALAAGKDNSRRCSLARELDVYVNSGSKLQLAGGLHQSSMQVHNDGFSIAGESRGLNLNAHANWYSCAPAEVFVGSGTRAAHATMIGDDYPVCPNLGSLTTFETQIEESPLISRNAERATRCQCRWPVAPPGNLPNSIEVPGEEYPQQLRS